jgi:DNA-binding response OmpR family regulator
MDGTAFNGYGQSHAAGRLRILVVDGNRDAADSLGMLLSLWGYDSRVAYSGETALNLAACFRPHVVFSEIIVPDQDGYRLARSLRAELPAAVLIALTGLGGEQVRTRSREAGFHTHVLKPADPDQLLEVLAGASYLSRRCPGHLVGAVST